MLGLEKIYEALLYWRGNLNADEFAEAVGRTRQRVQTEIITPFVQGGGKVIEKRGRKHGRTLQRPPTSAPEDLWAFFGLLAAERVWRRRERPDCSSFAGIDVVDLAPPAPASVSVWICRACAQNCALDGHYVFRNHGVCAVRFSPHTMVRTPRRIHFRGHLLVLQALGETQDWGYVDLVPGRFLDDSDLRLDESNYKGAEEDQDWHSKIEITFEINPALPRAAYLALQHEHGIEADREGRCYIKFPVRKALAYSYEHHVFDRTIGPERMKAWVRCPANG